jgi:hypothetical protein
MSSSDAVSLRSCVLRVPTGLVSPVDLPVQTPMPLCAAARGARCPAVRYQPNFARKRRIKPTHRCASGFRFPRQKGAPPARTGEASGTRQYSDGSRIALSVKYSVLADSGKIGVVRPPQRGLDATPHSAKLRGRQVRHGHRPPRNGSGGLAEIAASPLQQRAIVISKVLGFEGYFNAMVGQVPEQLSCA